MTSTTRAISRYIERIWTYRDLLFYLARGKIKATNAATTLGILWWVLNPLLLAGIYFLVFGVIFAGGRRGDPTYLAWLLSGMFPFHFTSRSVRGGADAITSNAKLITNIRFPRIILPASVLIEAVVGFLASIIVYYMLIVPLTGRWPGVHTLWLIPAVLLHLMMNLGLAALMGRLAVAFRDLGNLVPYVLRLWLYMSPIIWTIEFMDNLDPLFVTVAQLNPIFPILSLYRTGLGGYPFDPQMLLNASIWSIVILLAGSAYFIKGESRLTRYL